MERELNIKEIQNISLEILKTIADICIENGFRYCLAYGTLIGAIRHKDYIPWDDDVDIMMPREDYELLLEYMKNHSKDYKHLEVYNMDTCDEYPYMITRISDNRYRMVMENEKEYGLGIFIDIYPMDGLGNTKEEALKLGMKGDRLSSLCYQATRKHFAIETTTSLVRKVIKFPVYLFAKLIGKNIFQSKLTKLAGSKKYDESKYVGCVVWLSGGAKDIFERKWFDELMLSHFGKYEFMIPKEYDKVLRHAYGDYMQLPPEKERIGHHNYKIFKK